MGRGLFFDLPMERNYQWLGAEPFRTYLYQQTTTATGRRTWRSTATGCGSSYVLPMAAR